MRSPVIVLTGGIASGKTTVANRFVELGVPLFDADMITRELVAPGQPALTEIVAEFGNETLTPTGDLDRHRMRERILTNESARRRLEAILHPRVRSELHSHADACSAKYCMLAIPLYVESAQAYDWVDRVLVVDVPREMQLARLMQRDGMIENYAQRALAAQATRAQRLSLADDVIDNSCAVGALAPIVARLHHRYLLLTSPTA